MTNVAPFSRTKNSRRLSDHILVAFHHACDQGNLDVAENLLPVLETVVKRPLRDPLQNRRRGEGSLVAAHERLWTLRHPTQADE